MRRKRLLELTGIVIAITFLVARMRSRGDATSDNRYAGSD